MGSLLAIVLLGVPLIAWRGGTFLLRDSQLLSARFFRAPQGIFPISRKSYSPAIATRLVSQRAARRWMR